MPGPIGLRFNGWGNPARNILASQRDRRLVLNQLTFGEKVDSPDATKLPVLLAVALLKDRNGVIDIKLPISGSLDDPHFSIGGIVIQALINLLVKIVTAPFALLGSLGGGGEQLAQRIDRELSGSARVATHSQKTTAMCTAAQRLSEAISSKRIRHPDDEELNRHVLNAAAQQVGAAWKFVKRRKKGGKIDALIALAMAHSVLIAGPPKPEGKGIWFA